MSEKIKRDREETLQALQKKIPLIMENEEDSSKKDIDSVEIVYQKGYIVLIFLKDDNLTKDDQVFCNMIASSVSKFLKDQKKDSFCKAILLWQDIGWDNCPSNLEFYNAEAENGVLINSSITKRGEYAAMTETERHAQHFREHFVEQDGSVKPLVDYVKASMHNPDSFVHVKTTIHDGSEPFLIKMEFRGTNVFGGVVTNTVLEYVTWYGEVEK